MSLLNVLKEGSVMAIGVFAKKIKDIVDAELDSLASKNCVADLKLEHAGLQLIKAAIEFDQLRQAAQQINREDALEGSNLSSAQPLETANLVDLKI